VVAVGLTVLALIAAAALAGARLPWAVPALALATVAVWVVRVPLLLTHDHAATFVAVHVALAAVSVALAAAALRRSPARALL